MSLGDFNDDNGEADEIEYTPAPSFTQKCAERAAAPAAAPPPPKAAALQTAPAEKSRNKKRKRNRNVINSRT